MTVFRDPSHNTNGNTRDLEGRLLSCEHTTRRVTITERDGTYRTLLDKYDGKRFNSPNDIVVKSDGTIWLTDPTYGLPQGETKEQDKNYVFRFDPASGKLTAVASDFVMPNGLAFSPDGRHFYVDDSERRDIWVYDVAPGMELKNGRQFGKEEGPEKSGVPDGMRMDQKGNIFVTGPLGIWIWDARGNHLGTIEMPEQPANLAWGDPDYRTLYITATTSLYKLRTSTPGFVPYLKK